MPKAFDGIGRKKKRRKSSPAVLKNKFSWKYFLFIIVVLVFIFSIFLCVANLKNKIEVFRIFKNGKYLIVFQNNAELRPTGGFIGSFAMAEFSNYKLKSFNFDTNIYKLDNSFTESHIIPPPDPLAGVSSGKWAMRDSNWAISYPESAEKILWFYKQETGEDADGVIAVNASVLQDVLKITGPVEMEKYKLEINSDNFFTQLASQIEDEYFQSKSNKLNNEPKTILKDLLPEVFSKVKKEKLSLAKLFLKELREKQVLFFSRNANIENSILNNNWGGEISKTKSDYLMVNHANIADLDLNSKIGGKSSTSVNEKIEYKVEKEDELLIGNLVITRKHNGKQKWPDGINHNWTRILVPEGSVLKSADVNGKDIKKRIVENVESDKTSFGFWHDVFPQKTTVIKLTYVLPFSDRDYSLTLQKQPGNLGDSIDVFYLGKKAYEGSFNQDLEFKKEAFL